MGRLLGPRILHAWDDRSKAWLWGLTGEGVSRYNL
jgi:hypothetical protein